MLDSNSVRVANVEVYDKIALVSFSAQTPPRIRKGHTGSSSSGPQTCLVAW